MSTIDFAILSFGSLFAIVDPITLVPTFLAMTHKDNVKDRIRMAAVASVVTFGILLLFAACGKGIFRAFGITLPAFQIAGGIILMMIALDMLNARRTAVKETPEEQEEGSSKDDIAITPLAIPMLAGPGAITAVILLGSKAQEPRLQLVLFVNILLISLLSFFVLRLAAIRSSVLSGIGMKIFIRLMGLLLAAIAVQFIISGVQQAALGITSDIRLT